MSHWKHTATRCAVEGCERTRRKGWSTCSLVAHHSLGQSLYGAGRIAPIPAPAECVFVNPADGLVSEWCGRCGTHRNDARGCNG